jgi:hypothetical protein
LKLFSRRRISKWYLNPNFQIAQLYDKTNGLRDSPKITRLSTMTNKFNNHILYHKWHFGYVEAR